MPHPFKPYFNTRIKNRNDPPQPTQPMMMPCETRIVFRRGGTQAVFRGSQLTLDLLHEINRVVPPVPAFPSVVNVGWRDRIMLGGRTHFQQRFEWHGDKWLNHKLADMILESVADEVDLGAVKFGELEPVWAAMKSNAVFAMMAFHLGMCNNPVNKNSANIFEAYVRLLDVDDNRDALVPWIEAVFRPLVQFAADNYLRGRRSRADFEAHRNSASTLSHPPSAPFTAYHEEDGVIIIDDSDDEEEEDSTQAPPSKKRKLEQDQETEQDRDEKEVAEALFPGRELSPPDATGPQASSTVKQETDGFYKGAEAYILEIDSQGVLVKLPRSNARGDVRIHFKNSQGLTIDGVTTNARGGVDIVWRSLPTDENEAAQEDDDELMIEGFSSNWEQGMVVKVWLPLSGDHLEDLHAPLILMHPWDNRLATRF